MKTELAVVLTVMLLACSSDDDDGDDSKRVIRGLVIEKTTEGSSALRKQTFTYQDYKLAKYVVEQTASGAVNITSTSLMSFDENTMTMEYVSRTNGEYGYRISYDLESFAPIENLSVPEGKYPLAGGRFLSTSSTYTFKSEHDEPEYEMDYTVIGGTPYLKSITEYKGSVAYYALLFDYSAFDEGRVTLTQTLFGKKRLEAQLYITHDNWAGIPDELLFDPDFYPFFLHKEGIYGGLMGAFDYFVTRVVKTGETKTAAIERNMKGYPLNVTIESDKKNAKTTCHAFDYIF